VSEQPSGTVTLLFTDIEGSTRLLDELGPESYRDALGEHRRALREVFRRRGGYEVDYEGDAFFVSFSDATDGLAAAREAQAALGTGGQIRVRMGLHTGTPLLDPPKYIGLDVHLAARIMSASHGGQIVLSKATAALVDEPLHELGEHRLRDFAEPVALFQVGDDRFPPLKTISNTNLPRPASTFVGREREVIEIASLVRGGARLVTLTGPGGSGKTRLAIEAASELVPDFSVGVFWVGLAALREPALVLETIAQTLGAADALSAHVSEREMLLLLDNFEQVVEAAPELSALVETCPNLHLLVTSRELLRIGGETEVPVLPLAEPDAVELFRARARVGHDESVPELCRRLDNLPLAIELAAGAATALAPSQILERLSDRLDVLRGGRDLDPRQATLRSTIEWSYDLLDASEQVLFARLSIFSGGCAFDAAEQVADADIGTLRALIEKSLVRRTGNRYWMLETIREYAAERRLERRDADAVELRHWKHFLALARDAEKGERGPDQTQWWDRLEEELDNMRLALDGRRSRGDHLSELELAALLKRFWHFRGHLVEGRQRLQVALAAAPGAEGLLRARALAALAYCSVFLGQESAALTHEALDIYAALGDAAGVARMTLDLGVEADAQGDKRAARALYEHARVQADAAGDLRYACIAMHNLTNLAFQEADDARALRLGEEALAAARLVGDPALILHAALLVGYVLAGAGRLRDARELGIEVLAETSTTRVCSLCRDALDLLVIVEVETGEPERGTLLAGLAERLREETGEPRQPSGLRLYRPAVESAEAVLGETRFSQVMRRGAMLTVEEAVSMLDAAKEAAPHVHP